MGTLLPPADIVDMQRRGLLPVDVEAPVEKKPSKYRAERCQLHTPAHASLKECRRFRLLELMERGGKIRNLQQQVRFRLCPADCLAEGRHLVYVADFTYDEFCPYAELGGPKWVAIVEDTKGLRTPMYVAKRHLMSAKNIEIREI